MKQKKLNLADLEVRSFVTNVEDKVVDTVKGGRTNYVGCRKTINGDGCQWHTAIAHNCSDIVCYSNFCNSSECGGPVSDLCSV